MNKYYITFGQVHTHSVNGRTFDKDCVAEIQAKTKNEARDIAMDVFKGVFHQTLDETEIDKALQYFPRGIIKL